MNAAAVGLIGVIVGALLAGVVNLVLERDRRPKRARAAGRLIIAELAVAQEKVTSPLGVPRSGAKPGWWLGDLPIDAWRAHQSHLATEVSPDLMEYLARAYAICVSLNDEHAAASTTGDQPTGDLQLYGADIAAAKSQLERVSFLRTPRRRQRAVRWSVALAPLLFLIVLGLGALFAPRVDVNSTTVASALQSQIGSGVDVQCKPNAGEWSCTVYPLSSPVTCPAASTLAFLAARTAQDTLALPARDGPKCSNTSSQITFPATIGKGEIHAALVERSEHGKVLEELDAKLSKSSAWKRFWRSIWG